MKKSIFNFKKLALILFVFVLPFQVQAWGVLGHRIVGEIADHYLSKNARKAIVQILGTESMAMTANWADFIKSDTAYNYLSSWHYVNLPENLSKEAVFSYLDQETTPNIYNKLNEMIAVLKNPASLAEQKKLALRMVIHLMGDLHQPMHTARKDDLGGNRIVLSWFNEKSNLHRVWDEQLVDFQQLSYTEYSKVIDHASKAQVAQWQSASLKDEVYESYQVCNSIYATGIKMNDKVSYRYNFDWIATINSQLLKGGIRLAKVLNDIYS